MAFVFNITLLNYKELKKRIKKNEGYKNSFYLDSLGNPTIGYGHLIKKREKYLLKNKYSRIFLNKIFEEDFKIAKLAYQKAYGKAKHSQKIKELLIEMIFQLGIKGQKKFKKMNFHISKNNPFMTSLEMKNSLWYSQTPKRVDKLIEILLSKEYEKRI